MTLGSNRVSRSSIFARIRSQSLRSALLSIPSADPPACVQGRNCERFRELYCTPSLPRVGTPSIYWELTNRRVLTMQWIDGVKLTDQKGMSKWGLDIVDLVDVGIECTLRQLLEAGYVRGET